MAQRHTHVTCLAGVPTRVTDSPVAAIALGNPSDRDFDFQATLTDVAPTSWLGCESLGGGQRLLEDVPLISLFRGVGVGPYHIWVLSRHEVRVRVSHG